MKLPNSLRPEGRYRRVSPGTDVPRQFLDDLQGIDENLFLVWHPFRTLWDTIMNQYSGELENPRNTINRDYHDELIFGFVLTDSQGVPLPDNSWHVWRHCWPHGWAHVCKMVCLDPGYLKLFLNRLDLQARWSERYGMKSYNQLMAELEEEKREKLLDEEQEMVSAIHRENDWLFKKAWENAQRGHIKATNPTKDVIVSAPGVNKRSRIVRLITEKEAGLYTGD